jgi:hypothetical protein
MRLATGIARLLEDGFPEDLAADVAAGIIPEDEAVQILARKLPRNPAAKLERARSMDFDPVDKRVFHGTGADIQAFEPSVGGMMGPGIYTSPITEIASSYAAEPAGQSASLIRRRQGPQNIVTPEGEILQSGAVMYPLTYRGELMPYKEFLSEFRDATPLDIPRVQRELRESGVTGLINDPPPQDESFQVINIFDPRDLRSTAAAFNPEYKGANILGAAAPVSATVGIAALSQPEEAEAGQLDKALRYVSRMAEDADLNPDAPMQIKPPSSFDRGTRRTAKNARLSTQEKAAIRKSIEGSGIAESVAFAAARDWKRRHPPVDWEKVEITGVTSSGKGELSVVTKKPQYAFDKDKRTGKALKRGSPGFQKIVDNVANEVIDYLERANTDPTDISAQLVKENAGWYRNVQRRLRNEYGSFSEMMGDLLGATSANTDVATNFNYSKELLNGFARGDYDELMAGFADKLDRKYAIEDELAQYVATQRAQGRTVKAAKEDEFYKELERQKADISAFFKDQANLIRKPNGSLFGMNSFNSMVALADRFRVRREGMKPKIKNFSGNLVGDSTAATIDVWAARNLRRHSGRKPIPSSAEPGVTGSIVDADNFRNSLEFGFGQDVIEEVTDIINDRGLIDTPLEPRDVQALQWFIEKDYWTQRGWTSRAGEGGSFEQMMDSDPVESGFLGLSRDQSIDVQGRDFVPTTTEMQIANRKILNEASTDPNVVTVKALPSGGAFEKTPETALDIDIVSERDYLPVDALDAAARQAVEDDQKSWFFARRIRPEVGRTFPQFFTAGTEIYFDTGKRKGDQIIEDVEDYLLDNDYYGYTLIVDPRDADKILGMRVLQIPQYDGSAEKYAKMSQDAYATESRNEFQRFRDLGQRLTDEFGQVKDTSPGYFDVNAKSLEETQGYLAQLASRERGASLEDLREDFYGFKPAQERFKRYTGISEPAYPQEGAAGRGSSATNAAAAATTGAGIAALAGPGEAEALEVSDEGIESLPRDPELDEEPRTFRQEVSDLIEYGPSVAKDIFSEVIGKPLVGAAAAEKAYDLGLPAELIDDAAAYGRSVADYKPSPEVRAYEQRLKRGIVDLLQSDTAQFLAPLAKPILESLGEISEGVVEGGVGLQSLLRGETDEEKRRELERANRPALEAISPI